MLLSTNADILNILYITLLFFRSTFEEKNVLSIE